MYNLPDSEITINGGVLSENIKNIVWGNYEKTLLNAPERTEGVGTRTRSRNHTAPQQTQNLMTRSHRQSMRIADDDDIEEEVRPRRTKRGRLREEDDETFEADYQADSKHINPIPPETLEGRRVTRGALMATATRPQETRHSTRENGRVNTRESLPEEAKNIEETLGISKTRSGRTIVHDNVLRQTGGYPNRGSLEVEESSRQTRHSARHDSRPAVQQAVDSSENEGGYHRRLRNHKTGSMKLIDYDDFDDFEEEDRYNVATRKKVKISGNQSSQDREEEMDLFNGFEKDQNGTGRETRASSRLRRNAGPQEELRSQASRDQSESNPLEQNLSGVRTRSGLVRGTSHR